MNLIETRVGYCRRILNDEEWMLRHDTNKARIADMLGVNRSWIQRVATVKDADFYSNQIDSLVAVLQAIDKGEMTASKARKRDGYSRGVKKVKRRKRKAA